MVRQHSQQQRRSIRIPFIQSRVKKWDRYMKRHFEKAKQWYPRKFPMLSTKTSKTDISEKEARRTHKQQLPELVAELLRDHPISTTTTTNVQSEQRKGHKAKAHLMHKTSNNGNSCQIFDPCDDGYEVDEEFEEELVCREQESRPIKHYDDNDHSYHFSNQYPCLNHHPFVIERFKVRVFYS